MKKDVHKMKKSLGQNFLRDESIIEEIIDVAGLSSQDVVFEIGPGDGALTSALLATGARVVALEIDEGLLPALREKFEEQKNFTLLHEDIRRFNLPQFLANEKITSYKVVANLPYYITSSIIRYFLESEAPPSEMTIMVQKEVAERICAAPGALSVLGVSVQFFGTPEIQVIVPAEAFEPVPKVNSAVVKITDINRYGGHDAEYTKHFFGTVKAGFSARRKMLAGNLSNSLHIEKEYAHSILESIGLEPTARAQELTLMHWHELSSALGHDLKD